MALLEQTVEDPNWPRRRDFSYVSGGEGGVTYAVTLMVSFFKTLSIVYVWFLSYCVQMNNCSSQVEGRVRGAGRVPAFAGCHEPP